MEASEIKSMLDKLGIPVTNREFPPNMIVRPPFCVFLKTDIDTFLAENQVYEHENRYSIELYTENDYEEYDRRLIEILNEKNIVWNFISDSVLENGIHISIFGI